MKYPNFLKQGDVIGVTAISMGAGKKILEVKTSLNHLKEDYRLIVTPDVYGGEIVSASKEIRIKEFNDLLDENISALINLRGGDFGYEVIFDLDLEKVARKKLLVEGFSDATLLLYPLTTKYDLATLYGFSAKSFYNEELDKSRLDNLEFKKGNLVLQKSYHDRNTYSVNGDFTASGIIIGGCIDTIRFLLGTSLDGTKEFINKYKDKKVIWYFDNYTMNSIDLYLTLLQMKNMGYFKYSDTFIFGSVMYPNVTCNLEYVDTYKKALGETNIIVDANIGHIEPRFTILNGSLTTITFKDNELTLKQELMDEDNG